MTPLDRPVDVSVGLPEVDLPRAAELYYEAFRQKLGPALGPAAKAVSVLADSFDGSRAIAAFCGGRVVGLAGFHMSGRRFVTMGLRDLKRHYGMAGALWRGLVLSLFERNPKPAELLMDGIVVDADFRSHGIGSRILAELTRIARRNGIARIRLDVVDTNPAARRLYEREGFVAVHTTKPLLPRRWFGFSSSTTMVKEVGAA